VDGQSEDFALEAQDWEGRSVRWTQRSYQEHVPKHPEIQDYIEQIGIAVSDPDVIVNVGQSQVHLYKFGLGRGRFIGCYICVIIYYREGPLGEVEGRIATSYFTTRVRERGQVLWRRRS